MVVDGPFPGPLASEETLLGLFLSVSVGISTLLTSSAPNLGCMRQKETQGTWHCIVLRVPRALASPPSLHFQNLLVFVLSIMGTVFTCTWWEEWRKVCLSVFPGVEVPAVVH